MDLEFWSFGFRFLGFWATGLGLGPTVYDDSDAAIRTRSSDHLHQVSSEADAEELRAWVMINVGALIIRIGFWGLLMRIIVEYTPNPILLVQAPIIILPTPAECRKRAIPFRKA